MMHLVNIGLLTPVQQSKYGTLMFTIPKKKDTLRFILNFRKINQ